MNKITIIGVGGAGINTILNLKKLKNCNLLAFNTDKERLKSLKNIKTFTPETIDLIKKEVSDGSTTFILNGIGGKTGTIYAPKIASIINKTSTKVIAISTTPFNLEKKRVEKVDDFIKEMKKHSNQLILRSNQELVTKYPNYSMKEAFETADKEFSDKLKLFISNECKGNFPN